ncbi:MAG: hypothetical protein IT353_08945 [Gemmatimonadaceae bacterium]|nr:hypothetical protein [Gemmatimonadaceae bacterium]
MTSRLFAALAIAVVAAGCSEDPIAPPAFACTAVAYPAVAVSVLDSITGLGISAGSTIVVRDGAFVDSLVV